MKEADRSCVYMMECKASYDSKGRLIKIGYSKDPKKRLKSIQSCNPFKTEIIFTTFPMVSCHKMENWLHRQLRESKYSGEWFRLTVVQVEHVKAFLNEIYYNYNLNHPDDVTANNTMDFLTKSNRIYDYWANAFPQKLLKRNVKLRLRTLKRCYEKGLIPKSLYMKHVDFNLDLAIHRGIARPDTP